MSNSFDGNVLLEPDAVALWQNRNTNPPTDLLVVGYTATNPDGVRLGVAGSILSGPTGTYRSNGGLSWTQTAFAGEGQLRVLDATQIGTTIDAFGSAGPFGSALASTLVPAPELNAIGRTLRVRATVSAPLVSGGTTWELRTTLNGAGIGWNIVVPASLPSAPGVVATLDVTFQVTAAGVVATAAVGGIGSDFATTAVFALIQADPAIGDLTSDGTFQIRGVASVATGPGLDTLTLDRYIVDIG